MKENDYTISVGQLLSQIMKRWWLVLIVTILGAATVFCYTYFLVDPLYESSATLGVNVISEAGSSASSSYNESLLARTVAEECAYIVKSDITLDRAAKALNAYDFPENNGRPYRQYTTELLRKMITTSSTESNIRYFNVIVTSDDPKEAKVVCEFVSSAFADALKQEDLIKGAESKMIGFPKVAQEPSSPNLLLNTAIGAVVGCILAAGCILLAYFIKDTFDGEDSLISEYKDIPLLAVIPDVNSHSGGYRNKYYKSKYGYENTEASRK